MNKLNPDIKLMSSKLVFIGGVTRSGKSFLCPIASSFKNFEMFFMSSIAENISYIDKFKTDPSYRIIMLSSERCSSGSNLTEASHIIFADVVNGTPEVTKDIESQAIGRAVRIGQKKPVVVKRLIMKDTIEEEFYNKNKYDMTDLML